MYLRQERSKSGKNSSNKSVVQRKGRSESRISLEDNRSETAQMQKMAEVISNNPSPRDFGNISSRVIQKAGLAELKSMRDDELLGELATAQQEWKDESKGTPSAVNRIAHALASRARQSEKNDQDATKKWWSKKKEAERLLRLVRLRESPEHDETVNLTEMADVMKSRV